MPRRQGKPSGLIGFGEIKPDIAAQGVKRAIQLEGQSALRSEKSSCSFMLSKHFRVGSNFSLLCLSTGRHVDTLNP